VTISKYKKIQIVLVIIFFVGITFLLISVYMKPSPEFEIIEGKQVVLEGMSGETGRNTSVLSITTHGNPIDVLNVSGTLYMDNGETLVPLPDEYYKNLCLNIDFNETVTFFVGTFKDKYTIISKLNSDFLPTTEDIEINLYFSYLFPDVDGCKCKRFYSTYVFVPEVRIGYIP